MERRAEAEEDGVVVVEEGEEEEEEGEEPFPVFERQLSCRATTCVCGEGARGRREEGELAGECVCVHGDGLFAKSVHERTACTATLMAVR